MIGVKNMIFQCKACGTSFSAMVWNNYTRRNLAADKDFVPIQHIADKPDDPKIKKLKWFCPKCSIDQPDVHVKIDES